MTTTMIATGNAILRPAKMLGIAAGITTRQKTVARPAPRFWAVQINRDWMARKPK